MDAGVFLVAAGAYALVFGGLGCWISSEKGREPAEGIFLGLLFGPLGCLIAVLMPAPPSAAARPVPPPPTAAEHQAAHQRHLDWQAVQSKLAAAERAQWAEQRRIEAEEKRERIEARDKSYRARGVEPGPWAWFQVWPDWFQATLFGVAISAPFIVGIVMWQRFATGTP
jgi:hypothetical protein